MNERIGELYTEALKYADSKVPAEHRYNDIYYAIVSGKHAELIVRECMELTKQCSTGKGIHDLFADEIIAEHFGVEE